MATRTVPAIVVTVDDVTGFESSDENVISGHKLTLDGKHSATLDMSEETVRAFEMLIMKTDSSALRELLAPVTRTRTTPARSKEELDVIRAWGRANGYAVADHGRLSHDLLAAFDAAQSETDTESE
jgi:hypothetical protein